MKLSNRIYFAITFLILMLVLGTIVYHSTEKWTYFDSLYFSTTTIATVGFGDLHPVTYTGKFFTIFYVIIGVSTALYTLTLVAESYFEHNTERFSQTMGRWKERRENNLNRIKEGTKDLKDRIHLKKDDLIK
jgi:hypothetical protein